ncbi:MAG: hypothetical protein M0P69_11075 [Bacteroidales bacterium]|jgi:hypothetical protein|nr:hypothetical protein [Bacteroidales bacterium]MDD2262550.1 hypothetical protein [Clostridia bacterium]MDD2813616.1 hypothetical protein [Bacteroidales bacterium]
MVDKQKIIPYWHVEKKSEVELASVLVVSRNTVRWNFYQNLDGELSQNSRWLMGIGLDGKLRIFA